MVHYRSIQVALRRYRSRTLYLESVQKGFAQKKKLGGKSVRFVLFVFALAARFARHIKVQ